MKNKGFTLIELLAVIVILAIIALIATPVILGIIDSSRKSANARTVELITFGVQNAYTSYLMDNNGNYPSRVEDFLINGTYYNVDSTSLSETKITSGDVECTVEKKSTGDKVTVTCTGSFPEDFNATKEFTAGFKATS